VPIEEKEEEVDRHKGKYAGDVSETAPDAEQVKPWEFFL
jgi:hypothetical protein